MQRGTNTASFTFSIAGGSDLKCIRIELEEGTDTSVRRVVHSKGQLIDSLGITLKLICSLHVTKCQLD